MPVIARVVASMYHSNDRFIDTKLCSVHPLK